MEDREGVEIVLQAPFGGKKCAAVRSCVHSRDRGATNFGLRREFTVIEMKLGTAERSKPLRPRQHIASTDRDEDQLFLAFELAEIGKCGVEVRECGREASQKLNIVSAFHHAEQRVTRALDQWMFSRMPDITVDG